MSVQSHSGPVTIKAGPPPDERLGGTIRNSYSRRGACSSYREYFPKGGRAVG